MTIIRLRRGSAAAWTSANPILAAGEPGVELDTGFEKIGDGTHHWANLGYTKGPGSGAIVLSAIYEDAAVVGTNPHLALNTDWDHSADGVAVAFTPGNHSVAVLVAGTYTITHHGEVFKAGTTGGNVIVTITRSGVAPLIFDAEGAVQPGDVEYDATVTVTLPLNVGDTIFATLNSSGATVEGFSRLVVTKIA